MKKFHFLPLFSWCLHLQLCSHPQFQVGLTEGLTVFCTEGEELKDLVRGHLPLF